MSVKNATFQEFDVETHNLIADFMEKAGLEDLNTREDFEKIIVALVDSYSRKELSLNDLAFLFGKLEMIFNDNGNLKESRLGPMELGECLMMGSDLDWYAEYDLSKAVEMLDAIIEQANILREKHKKYIKSRRE